MKLLISAVAALLMLDSVAMAAETPAKSGPTCISPQTRARARELGIAPGVIAPGPLNAITDVDGVRVGQITYIQGKSIRTGATAILPHGGNIFQDRVPAGFYRQRPRQVGGFHAGRGIG